MSLPRIRRRDTTSAARLRGVSPLMARLLAGRGVKSTAELAIGLEHLPGPDCLPGMAAAVELLLQARQERWQILVLGDYDADGATATALMMEGLARLGFAAPRFRVPDRFAYGYGLSEAIVAQILSEAEVPQLVLTVDNGIASVAGVAAARAAGLKVLVTDHHLPGAQLPDAEALVNPRLDPSAPGQCLAGVGVALYVLLAVRKALRALAVAEGDAPLGDLLDLVALGTVADVVPLDQTNRILVEQGLRRIRAGHCRPGIRALLRAGKCEPAWVSARDLGFAVAPRLNAAGRLSHMSLGIECLLARDPDLAAGLAAELDGINRDRRVIERDMRDSAMQEVRALQQQTSGLPAGLCLYHDYWHEGVVGILASRIREAVNRPVIALAPAQAPGWLKGSGRSLPGLHLRDVLDRVATSHPGLLERFGGHAMAAGLTLAADRLDAFRDAFSEVAAAMAPAGLYEQVVDTDGTLDQQDISLPNARLLATAFPWGQGFPEPLFEGDFEVLNHKILQSRHLRLTLGLPHTSSVVDGVYFNAPVDALPASIRRVQGLYRLDLNHFRGRQQLQLVFEHLAW